MLEKKEYIHTGTKEAFEEYTKESLLEKEIEEVYNPIFDSFKTVNTSQIQ